MLIMLFVSHVNACIIFAIAHPGDEPGSLNPYNVNRTITPADMYSESWFFEPSFYEKNLGEQYFWCFFKSISHMLTIGYGVNQPRSTLDLIAAIWAMFSTFLYFLPNIRDRTPEGVRNQNAAACRIF